MKKKTVITSVIILVAILILIYCYSIFNDNALDKHLGNISPEICIEKGGEVFNAGDGSKECPVGKKEIATIEGYLWCHCKCCK